MNNGISNENPSIRSHVFKTEISQLDALLKDGGIVIPQTPDKHTGVSVLLKGPAGAGKSTLALLLAAQCAKNGGPVLYCALEQSIYSLKRLSLSFDIDNKTQNWDWVEIDAESDELRHPTSRGFICLSDLHNVRMREKPFEDYLETLKDQVEAYINNQGKDKVSMIIIDSLTVFGQSSITRPNFEVLKRTLDNENRILIFIGESDEKQSLLDRLVDMVIELSSKVVFGEYFLRTITIQKARFQNHILGSHVIKIKGKNIFVPPSEQDSLASDNAKPEGLVIYPSLHYHLSVAIERKNRLGDSHPDSQNKTETTLLQTGFSALDDALGGGIKRGTMTAISSNISYVARGIGISFLAEGVKNGERSLYISLQDDPDSITNLPSNADVKKMVAEKQLVIKSFRPGFISAEEFVDRIIKEILEKPHGSPDKEIEESFVGFQRVLFDDESQISLRFPLLDQAPVFLPTLMDIFKLYDMTALFLSTTISPGSLNKPPKDDLYDLVNTVIEVQESDPDSPYEAIVRIRKIAEQFAVPPQLKLDIGQNTGGGINIKKF